MGNLDMYTKYAQPPADALKEFNNGRFKGTDINPMWRIRVLTEEYGECGIGWYCVPKNRWTETAEHDAVINGKTVRMLDIAVFYEVELYVKRNGEWSMPIYGVGGNSFSEYSKKQGRIITSDEAYKMAYTDALGIACKALGIGANVWWKANDSKYTRNNQDDEHPQQQPKQTASSIICRSCNQPIPAETLLNGKRYTAEDIAGMSKKKYGIEMCYSCKRKADQSDSPSGSYDARAEQETVEGARGAIAS